MEKKKLLLFIVYFSVIYTLLSLLLLKTIATPLVNLWEFLIKALFGNFFNYAAFVFVPVCSGVISISIYLGVVIAARFSSFEKKLNIIVVLSNILLLWLVNFLRLLLVLLAEKISLNCAKITHIASWFVVGGIILGLLLFTHEYFKK